VIALAIAALPALVLLLSEAWVHGDLSGFPLDDAWIHLTFARSLAAGDGLAYRAGAAPVAGSTAPLWTLLLAPLAALPQAAAATATKLLGLALHLVGLALIAPLGRRLGLSPGRSLLATVLVGWSDGLVLASTSGMEVPLFTALFGIGLRAHLDERRDPGRPPWSFVAWGLLALTRPEALLLAPLAALDRVVAGEPGGGVRLDRTSARPAWLGLAVAAAIVLPVGVAFHAMSGSALPTTLGAKTGSALASLPPLRKLSAMLGVLFAAQPLPTLLAAGGAAVLIGRLGGSRDSGLLLPAWSVAMPVGLAMVGGDELLVGNFGRYVFPLLPCVVLLGLIALEPLEPGRFRRMRLAARTALPVGVIAAALLLLAPPLVRSVRSIGLVLTARGNVEDSDVRAARWLEEHAAPDELVATVDIGVLGWRLPNPLLDLGGIVDPERREVFDAAGGGRSAAWSAALLGWIETRRPEWVVVFPRWFPLLERDPLRFPARARFRIQGNVAMAGDELVVYSTPWTRPVPREVPSK